MPVEYISIYLPGSGMDTPLMALKMLFGRKEKVISYLSLDLRSALYTQYTTDWLARIIKSNKVQ